MRKRLCKFNGVAVVRKTRGIGHGGNRSAGRLGSIVVCERKLEAAGYILRESRTYPCSLNRGAFHRLWSSDTGAKPTSLSQPDKPGSRSAVAHLLLKQVAGIVAESSPAYHVLCSALAGHNTVCRGRQISMNLAGAGHTQASDFPARIDGATRH